MDKHTKRKIEAGFAKVEQLYRAGRYSEAIPVAERLCKRCATVLRADHPDTAKGDYARAAIFNTFAYLGMPQSIRVWQLAPAA